MKRKLILEAEEVFKNSTEDIFPYVESAIDILDDNLNWWKNNYEDLENDIEEALDNTENKSTEVFVEFTIYNGKPDDEEIIWHVPVIKYTFDLSYDDVRDIQKELGDTWNGKRIFVDNNSLLILFE